jgi:hypothetical protein
MISILLGHHVQTPVKHSDTTMLNNFRSQSKGSSKWSFRIKLGAFILFPPSLVRQRKTYN